MTKREQIESIVMQRYPCMAIPWGHMTRVAAEVGCTREYVRQIANAIGARGARGRIFSSNRVCAGCGQQYSGTGSQRYCSLACGNLWSGIKRRGRDGLPGPWAYTARDVVCPCCGSDFAWTPEQQWHRARNVRTGNVRYPETGPFCSQRCGSRWRAVRMTAERQAETAPFDTAAEIG